VAEEDFHRCWTNGTLVAEEDFWRCDSSASDWGRVCDPAHIHALAHAHGTTNAHVIPCVVDVHDCPVCRWLGGNASDHGRRREANVHIIRTEHDGRLMMIGSLGGACKRVCVCKRVCKRNACICVPYSAGGISSSHFSVVAATIISGGLEGSVFVCAHACDYVCTSMCARLFCVNCLWRLLQQGSTVTSSVD